MPRLALVFAVAILFGGCSSENLSTKGQLVECTVSANGPTDCHATDSSTPSHAGACVDVDEDGDGDAHDADEADDGADDMDDDHDGTPDELDDDDDNDGIPDTDDCDETPGGDDHDD